jgi:hypothetical protein
LLPPQEQAELDALYHLSGDAAQGGGRFCVEVTRPFEGQSDILKTKHGGWIMLNLQDVKDAVDHFSPEDLRELRRHLEKREVELRSHPPLSAEERIRRMDEAAKAIRSGFSEAEWTTIENAMNEEYIEPWNESEWTE